MGYCAFHIILGIRHIRRPFARQLSCSGVSAAQASPVSQFTIGRNSYMTLLRSNNTQKWPDYITCQLPQPTGNFMTPMSSKQKDWQPVYLNCHLSVCTLALEQHADRYKLRQGPVELGNRQHNKLWPGIIKLMQAAHVYAKDACTAKV